MQRQDAFVAARRADWEELDRLLRDGQGFARLRPEDIARATAIYRAVCADLMRARAAGYGPDVVLLLDGLAARGHGALYRAEGYRAGAIWDLVARDFPRTLRRQARFCALAAALFTLPALLGFFGARSSRAFALGVLPEATAAAMEESYAKGFNQGRGEGQDAAMAGFYVFNNIGIAFRCFATGVLLGLGSIFFLVYNGLVTGAVAGVVVGAGHGGNFSAFVCTHGVFELTAVVIAGAAGMVMGYALVDTGGQSRWRSLRARAPDLATMVLGAAAMLAVAAALEAFWSPSALPAVVKRLTATVLAGLLAFYFLYAGRGRDVRARAAAEAAGPAPGAAAPAARSGSAP